MILAFDTYYYDNKAKTVCLVFNEWKSDSILNTYSEVIENVSEYQPGEFYKRELPCILSLMKKIELKDIQAIIVDGFVFLDDNNRPGLGARLYEALDKQFPVIGVAKTNFASINENKRAVLRGKSVNPLYVTSIGIDLDTASLLIASMHGDFRMPTILKELDRLTKEK